MIAIVDAPGTTALAPPPDRADLREGCASRSAHRSFIDQSLIARARRGDRAALASLWEVNRRWVAVVLLAHKPADVDLEDLLQEVAMTLVTRLDDLRDAEGFRGWLRMVAVNAARAAARSAGIRRMHRLDAEIELSSGAPGATEEGPPVREDAQRLLELSLRLDEEYREPLLLKSLHGMSYRQIGVLLNLPETTVETRITRARRRLRELANNPGQHGDPAVSPHPVPLAPSAGGAS